MKWNNAYCYASFQYLIDFWSKTVFMPSVVYPITPGQVIFGHGTFIYLSIMCFADLFMQFIYRFMTIFSVKRKVLVHGSTTYFRSIFCYHTFIYSQISSLRNWYTSYDRNDKEARYHAVSLLRFELVPISMNWIKFLVTLPLFCHFTHE